MDITTNGRSRGSENPQPLMSGSASVSGCFGGDTPPGARSSFRATASADDAPSSAKPSSFFLLLMFTREPKCLYADNGGTGGTAAFLECLESCRISDPSVGSSAVRPLAREGCRSNVAVLKNCSAPSEAGHLLSQCPPPLAGAITIQVLVRSSSASSAFRRAVFARQHEATTQTRPQPNKSLMSLRPLANLRKSSVLVEGGKQTEHCPNDLEISRDVVAKTVRKVFSLGKTKLSTTTRRPSGTWRPTVPLDPPGYPDLPALPNRQGTLAEGRRGPGRDSTLNARTRHMVIVGQHIEDRRPAQDPREGDDVTSCCTA
ncbi:hypothetical protein THAOC_04771 [Thalassiosira oceanica]|uniref:Uncharacterized protein n=1 Tax=Thalassiosira oceanica TaxID=159749 RepID=K0TNJ5_THAOC|nr:hypothetical protein THAOC_04771 [Thalassiosira oceanica]|eukprot:EJK73592.1 hypothetical protein THAOC_04771 [Thalassiosira oceanica]